RQQSIQLDWNKTSCDWVGFGIGWDGYNPKDLSSITNEGAFILEMRAIENEATIPTLIFLLEDYGTTFSAGVFGASCIESYPINEQWQTCVLPLSAFDLDESGIDLTNIKQLVVECQGSGNVIIDNIRIGKASDYPRPEREEMAPSVVSAKVTDIYNNGFASVWGLGEMQGRSFTETKGSANSYLSMEWEDCKDCQLFREIGFSWTEWKAVDASNSKLFFAIAMDDASADEEANIELVLEGYDYSNKAIALSDDVVQKKTEKDKTTYLIPIGAFADGVSMHNIKQAKMRFNGNGSVKIDNIKLVK
ncbi:MAG: hypothetical protein AAF193_11085, partial [Bacteroidota bacterium]